jgi:hypothetical protein
LFGEFFKGSFAGDDFEVSITSKESFVSISLSSLLSSIVSLYLLSDSPDQTFLLLETNASRPFVKILIEHNHTTSKMHDYFKIIQTFQHFHLLDFLRWRKKSTIVIGLVLL